jgi:hypothetical protein
MLRGLRSIFTRFQVRSFFLVGPERPFQRSYFACVHTRKILLGPTIVKAAIQIGHNEV